MNCHPPNRVFGFGWNFFSIISLFGLLTGIVLADENDLPVGKPVVGRNADARLEVFQVDSRGELRHRWQKEPNGNWSAWASFTGNYYPGIAVANDADGHLEVFAVDRATHLVQHARQRALNNLNWSEWSALGTCAVQSPLAVGQNTNGTLEIFAVGLDGGTAKHIRQTSVNGGWSAWNDMGGDFEPDLVVAKNKFGLLELFGINREDSVLMHCRKLGDGSDAKWTAWENMGRPVLPGFTVGQNQDGRLEVFAINKTNGHVDHMYQEFPPKDLEWSVWSDFSATLKPGIISGTNADGRLEVFGVNPKDDSLIHRWQIGEPLKFRWSSWSLLGGSIQPYPALGQNQDGNLEIFAIDKKDFNTLDHRRQISGNSDWLDWLNMDHVPPQYSVRAWQVEDGLPNNMVRAITQTPDGFLWVGTRKGLVKFDGLHFSNFDVTKVGLSNSNISALCVDHDGALWIGSFGDGMVCWKDGKATHYGTNDGLVGDELNVIFQAKDRSFWIGSNDGLTHYKDEKFIKYLPGQGLLSPVVRSICEDNAGILWVSTAGGLHRFKNGKLESFTQTNGLPHNSVRGMWQDRGNRLWIGSDHGMVWYHTERYFEYGTEFGLSDNFVTAIREDRQGTLWVGTSDGLNRFREGRFFNEPNNEGVNYDSVNTLFEDREGNVWVGSREGLARLTPKRVSVYTRRRGLTHNNVTSIREDRTGSLWLTTWGGGVDKIAGEKITAYTTTNGFPHDLALSTCEDHDGGLWVGMDFDGGIVRIKNGNVKSYRFAQGLPKVAVRVIYEDSSSNLWVGTSRGICLFTNGMFINYTEKYGLPGKIVRVIFEDHAHRLWFGTESGLTRWKDGRFENFGAKQGLTNTTIIALYEDREVEPNLWIGTEGAGLIRYRDSRFTTYTQEQGLFSDNILEILEDDEHWLWMSCNRGIFRVRKRDLDALDDGSAKAIASITYGKADGMESTLCNGVSKPAGWKTRDGRLLFPTTKGLIAVDPHIEVHQTPPSVFIETFTADRKPFSSGGAREGDGETADTAVQIPPGRGELEFQYTALNLQTPEKCRFKYKLENVDSDWIDADTRRIAHYNNIYPGSYRFRVIACNNDGVWNENGATVSFVLEPHFWQTWWFLGLSVLVAVGSVGGTVRYVTWQKVRRQLELLEQQHAVERERGRIAKDIHDELGSSLTRIMLLGQRTQEDIANPKELAVHAGRIVNSARTTVQSLDEIVWAVDPKKDTLDGLVGYISQYVTQFFEGTEIRCRLELPVNTSSLILPAEVRHNLFLGIKEALNNALKHSHATEVRVRLTEASGTVTIAIEDDGRGFEVGKSNGSRKGNGLENMRKRMENLGAEFLLVSAPGRGTKLSFAIHVAPKSDRN